MAATPFDADQAGGLQGGQRVRLVFAGKAESVQASTRQNHRVGAFDPGSLQEDQINGQALTGQRDQPGEQPFGQGGKEAPTPGGA